MSSKLNLWRAALIAACAALLAAPAIAQTKDTKGADRLRQILKSAPVLQPADPCENPQLSRSTIRLNNAAALRGDATQIRLTGCFGRNQSGQLRAWVRKTQTPSDAGAWTRFDPASVSWEVSQATLSLRREHVDGFRFFEVTLVRMDPQTGAYQLSDWVRVTIPASDADGDGHASIAMGGDDCDDQDPDRYPGNVEVVDPADRDEDCDPSTFGYRDADGDGFVTSTACNVQPDGSRLCGTDCADLDPFIHPQQLDILNNRDDNCNGAVDEHQTLEQVRRMLGL